MSYLRVNTFLFVILIVFTACSDTKLMTPETEGEKLQILYNDAMELVKKRDFVDAAALFEDIERDQEITSKAKKAFNEVINKFPKSEFAIDALTRIDILDDRLAAKEMEIGRFYQFDHQWISAINRYNVVLNEYKTSIYTEEALHRLVEIYYSLGLHEEAKRYAATLQFNFPGSDWYIKSYELVKDLS